MTKTQENLLKAFAGESQARNRYTYFASIAKREGFEQIAAIFLDTSDNEREHAKVFYKHLGKGSQEITATYPFLMGTTKENLLAAAEGEKEEWDRLYKDFEATARKEGMPEVADSFKQIAEVEKQHEQRYRKLLKSIEDGKVFKRDNVVKWRCRNCGYVHTGNEAPKVCPACKHPQSYYEILVENY
jgi:rubrerythrin